MTMRRNEFEEMDGEELDRLLNEMSFGVLGTIRPDGWPELTPLNFVLHEGHLYFHGSRAGQKMRNLRENPKVTFSVAKEFAIIPSYFSDPKLACPATAFFKSVILRGYGEIVEDLQEKADALAAFMRKLQPEGGYEPITPADAEYALQLKATSVVKIRIEERTGKYKFGQNMQEERMNKVIEGLDSRGLDRDEETAQLMKAYCPHHQKKE